MSRINNKNKRINLDNSANIYAATKKRKWTNVFRLSMTFHHEIDGQVLKSALSTIIKRFPSIAARLDHNMQWYYIEAIEQSPNIQIDERYPLKAMSFSDIQKCAFRVLYIKNRLSVEFFHALTDGYGGTIFIKTLAAEYLVQKYGIAVSFVNGVLDPSEQSQLEELEDSHFVYATGKGNRMKEKASFHLKGTKNTNGQIHNTTIVIPSKQVLAVSKKNSVSLTEFLSGLMIAAILNIQEKSVYQITKRKTVRVLVPINLRRIFDSHTLRNFTYYALPGIDPKMGDYSVSEVIHSVHHQMRLSRIPQNIIPQISANVQAEKKIILRIMPLFIKNFALRTAFHFWGENNSALSLSNLGTIELPEEMVPYVKRVDFLLGVRSKTPYNCGIVSYEEKLYINFTRNIVEPVLENQFIELLNEQNLQFVLEKNSESIFCE